MLSLVLLVLAALFALWFWIRFAGLTDGNRGASATKTLSTALLALAAGLAGGPVWLVAGLAFGAAGDFFLSRPSQTAFLAGMGAFALGHFAYAWGLWHLGPGLSGAGLVFWVVLMIKLPILALALFWIAPKAGELAQPVRAYSVIIALMALSAALLPGTDANRITQYGVALFVASDLVLAFGLFVFTDARHKWRASKTLWPLYWGGQALIFWGGAMMAA